MSFQNEYDRLGLTTVTLVLNNDKDGNLIPESLSMDTTYYVGENKFGVSTVCKFSDYTSEALKLPEYVKIKKQSKVSKKK